MEQRRCVGLLLGAGQRRAQGTARGGVHAGMELGHGGSQGKQGHRSKVEEGARAHEGELLLLAELRHGQRNGDSRGEVRRRRALSLLQPWGARKEEGAHWPWSRGVAGGKRRPAQARADAWSAQEKPGRRELVGRYPAAERHGQGGSSLRAAVWEKECVLLS
jgi:hypothetical protein